MRVGAVIVLIGLWVALLPVAILIELWDRLTRRGHKRLCLACFLTGKGIVYH